MVIDGSDIDDNGERDGFILNSLTKVGLKINSGIGK
jgi:hypothetical protein